MPGLCLEFSYHLFFIWLSPAHPSWVSLPLNPRLGLSGSYLSHSPLCRTLIWWTSLFIGFSPPPHAQDKELSVTYLWILYVHHGSFHTETYSRYLLNWNSLTVITHLWKSFSNHKRSSSHSHSHCYSVADWDYCFCGLVSEVSFNALVWI